MIIGALIMATAMFALGMTFYLQHMGLAALLFMLLFVAGFAMSWGPVSTTRVRTVPSPAVRATRLSGLWRPVCGRIANAMASAPSTRWLIPSLLLAAFTINCSGTASSAGSGGGQNAAAGAAGGSSSAESKGGAAGNEYSAGTAGFDNAGTSSAGGSVPTAGASSLGGSTWLTGVAGAAGATAVPVPDLGQWIQSGALSSRTSPRPDFGGLVVATDGTRSYVVESRREITTGPLGLPWRSRFRLAAYEREVLLWAYVVDPDDLISDVVVHPSGDLTVVWESYAADELAYRLVRLTRDGTPKFVATLAAPTTIPASDHAESEPRPLLRMKSPMADATTAGWLRLVADGEHVVTAILSYVHVKIGDEWSNRLALAIEAMDLGASGYVERWARVVDGTHSASPAAWAYDELRWREQAVRPFLAHDDTTHAWLVGRAWNNTRCSANRLVFAEFTAAECVLTAVSAMENERLPLAVTRFSSAGDRLGTRVLSPEPGAAEQVPFALIARDGLLYAAGSLVRTNADGSKHTYPDAAGMVDYDGYVGIYASDGTSVAVRDVNLGRGDVLTALRFTPGGLIAVGAAGWDRWQGGMSISRGSDPLLVWTSNDTSRVITRTATLSDGSRHFGLHDVGVLSDSVVAFGFADAPMTHSADSDPLARTFGGLILTVTEPKAQPHPGASSH